MHIIPDKTFLWRLFRKALFALAGIAAGCLVVSIASTVLIATTHRSRILPGIRIGPVAVGGMTRQEALGAVAEAVKSYRLRWPVSFKHGANLITVSLPPESVHYDMEGAVTQAYQIGKFNYEWRLDTLTQLLKRQLVIKIPTTVDEVWLASESARIANEVDDPMVEPSLEVVQTASGSALSYQEGKDGLILKQKNWQQRIKQGLADLTLPEPVLDLEPQVRMTSLEQQEKSWAAANTLLHKRLLLTVSDQQWELNGSELVGFVDMVNGYNRQLLSEYLESVAESVNRPPKDAKFQFDESTGKVNEFVAAEPGIEVNVDETVELLTGVLEKMAQGDEVEEALVVIKTTMPEVGLSEVNRLGIRERIGVGKSEFKGSIASRVHNVALAASRINGTLIKPGEEFSFNAAVGDISAATGYQAAYIIRNGRTELGDGGGVCQDSTTVFRAALDAGLPITMRRGHAYRVGYYEQDTKPGIDATVYSPSPDLKFLNDTPGHILIQTEVDIPNRILKVYFYGTSDGRKTTIKDHVIWDVTPPPPDVYVDDPTLSKDVIKQVDWKAPGTKAKFTYLVERDGQVIIEKTFTTVYRPWASVFLRGTKE